MPDKDKIIFKPRARILLQLGDQLIKNESIALLELVKNSYDANATHVSISMENVDNPAKGIIVVEDNGIGMDMGIIKNVWMEPASDYKEKLLEENKTTKKFKRLPLGEKGIGRFSVYKLGEEIELITRKGKGDEIVIKIDWNDFQDSKYLDEMPVKIFVRAPEVFTGAKTGTKMIVKRLKTAWTKQMIRDVYRSINSMCSPFDAPDSFTIAFHIDKKEWIEGLLSWEQVKDYSLFSVECEIEGQKIGKFDYKFMPWQTMKKLHPRHITEKDDEIRKTTKMVDRDNVPIDLSVAKIGKVRFEALIFDRDAKILSLGVQDKKGLKEYLDTNGGIRIYRDGIRVYDYGEPGNDWLELGIRRINIPTKRISNNIILGAIHLEREASRDLVEKTNREGFIDNEAYNVFKASVLYALEKFETLREIDKDKIRKFYGPTPVSEPVISGLTELKEVIDKKIKDAELKKEVGKYLKRIEHDYRNISEIYIRSAGAGLTLSVVIHEVEKIIDELGKVVEREKPSIKIVHLVKHLSKIIEGYTIIIRKSNRREEDLKELIEQAVFNIELRLKAHGIEVIREYAKEKGPAKVQCLRNMVLGAILNILDNSIWWLDYAGGKNKKIFISVSNEMPGYTSVLIADNGPGFTLPTEEITKPFVSGKPDGMGLGLHIVKTIMESHGGEVIFPETGDFSFPEEFKNGAKVVLAFKKEMKK